MPGILNYSAWIEVDGKKLPEYDVQYSENGTQATCWIPSEAGKVCFPLLSLIKRLIPGVGIFHRL
jgi:hypothetical protein